VKISTARLKNKKDRGFGLPWSFEVLLFVSQLIKSLWQTRLFEFATTNLLDRHLLFDLLF